MLTGLPMIGIGPLEVVLIVVVIALIFGAKKLPELGKGMGKGIREFKKEIGDSKDESAAGSRPLESTTTDSSQNSKNTP